MKERLLKFTFEVIHNGVKEEKTINASSKFAAKTKLRRLIDEDAMFSLKSVADIEKQPA